MPIEAQAVNVVLAPLSAALAAKGVVNERGKPYNAKSISAMLMS